MMRVLQINFYVVVVVSELWPSSFTSVRVCHCHTHTSALQRGIISVQQPHPWGYEVCCPWLYLRRARKHWRNKHPVPSTLLWWPHLCPREEERASPWDLLWEMPRDPVTNEGSLLPKARTLAQTADCGPVSSVFDIGDSSKCPVRSFMSGDLRALGLSSPRELLPLPCVLPQWLISSNQWVYLCVWGFPQDSTIPLPSPRRAWECPIINSPWEQCSNGVWWELVCIQPSTMSIWVGWFWVCVLHPPQMFPCTIKLQSLIVVAGMRIYPLLALFLFLPHLPTSYWCSFISQINFSQTPFLGGPY